MIHKTKGVALHFVKYSESSVIATIYTEDFGRQAYMIRGVRRKKAAIRTNVLQPLFLLDMEVMHKTGRDIQNVKEVKNSQPFSSIPYDIVKSTQAIFIGEVLYRTLQEEESNPALYQFITHAVQILDLLEEGVANFSLWFLARYCGYLGFAPQEGIIGEEQYFDIQRGKFVSQEPIHPNYMKISMAHEFKKILELNVADISTLKFSNHFRRALLEQLIQYYSIHLEGIGKIQSLKVLHEVFS
ncbi:DNA repair protein RecO [Puteibacter caeruleilacunae]|nr:DNA repair protein RecO [Puteibacter caeruleilacunae]